MKQEDISLSSLIKAMNDIKSGRTSGRMTDRPAGISRIVKKMRDKIYHDKQKTASAGKKGSGRHRSDRRMSMGEGKAARMPTSMNLQRCITKVAYSSNTKGRFTQSGQSKAWSAHGKYLERDAGTVASNAKGYGCPNESRELMHNLPLWKAADEWQKDEDRTMFKVIISPEYGDRLGDKGLEIHVQRLVKAIEEDIGHEIKWGAINHHNTAHPHAHLIFSSKDIEGKEFELSPNYIVHGIMQRSMEILTEQLGYRLNKDISDSIYLQTEMHKVTSLDRALLEMQNEDGMIDLNDRPENSNPLNNVRNTALLKRLQHLRKMGLAIENEPLQWEVHPGANDILEDMAVYNERNKILMRHRKHMLNPLLPSSQTQLTKIGDQVSGRCLGFGIDPYSEKPFVLIEGVDNKFHFLEVDEATVDERALKEKQWIEISLQRNKKYKLKKYRNMEAFAASKLLSGSHQFDDQMEDRMGEIPTISAQLAVEMQRIQSVYHQNGQTVDAYLKDEKFEMGYFEPERGRNIERSGIVADRFSSAEDGVEWVQLKQKDYRTDWYPVNTDQGFRLGQSLTIAYQYGQWIEKQTDGKGVEIE